VDQRSIKSRWSWRTASLYVAASLSLVLLLATLLAWTWLGRYQRSIAYVRPNSQIQVGAFPKAVIIDRSVVTWSLDAGWEIRDGNFFITGDAGRETGKHVRLYMMGGAAVRTITRTFSNENGGPFHQRTEFGLWIPYWLLLMLTCPLPLWAMTIHRRRRNRASRRSRGLCEDCGYDLRATPGRCPECGTSAHRGLLARLKSLRLKSLWAREMGRAGIEPETHGFSVHFGLFRVAPKTVRIADLRGRFSL
jgi:hypothetical protein